MYVARFSYDVMPIDREQAMAFINREVEAARAAGLTARLLIPLTRPVGGPSLQFEVELASLDQLDTFRQCGVGSRDQTGEWMHGFSRILRAPPTTEVFRLDG